MVRTVEGAKRQAEPAIAQGMKPVFEEYHLTEASSVEFYSSLICFDGGLLKLCKKHDMSLVSTVFCFKTVLMACISGKSRS